MKTCLHLLVLMLSMGYLPNSVAQSSGSTQGAGSSVSGRVASKKQDNGAVNRGVVSGNERGAGASGTGTGTSGIGSASAGDNGGSASSGSSSTNQTNDTGNASSGSGGGGTNTPNPSGNRRSR